MGTMRALTSVVLTLSLSLFACRSEPKVDRAPENASTPSTVTAAASAAAQPAAVGAPAPDFTLPDLDGKPVQLSSFKGKTVVLEWFNPECPFVRKSHEKGSLVDTAKRLTGENVVWLAVNSGAPGKQGHGKEKNAEGRAKFGLTHPILLDESGVVGKLYGAKRTPHLYVVNGAGTLVYRGAVDNSPDAEGESPTGGKLIRYVEEALAALGAGKPVPVAETEAYGCSVKYAQ
jgi:peroxiredoxin